MTAKLLSDSLVAAISAVGPSVVQVNGRRRPSTGIAWSEGGEIITAAHTLRDDAPVTVTLPDGREMPARIVGADHGTDVALLAIEAELAVPRWSEGGTQVGELVVIVSRSGSFRGSLGMIGAVNGPWRTATGGRIDRWIDVDGSLPPGGSGGPLVDTEGAVLGMNTSALSRGGGTVPAATLRRVVDALRAHGGVRRGWLGVGVQTTLLGETQTLAAGQERGLLVASLQSDGPAAGAGLRVGDILLAIGGKTILDPAQLSAFLDESTVDVATPVRLWRGDGVVEIAVTVAGKVARVHGRCGR